MFTILIPSWLKKDILVFDEGKTDGLHDTAITADTK